MGPRQFSYRKPKPHLGIHPRAALSGKPYQTELPPPTFTFSDMTTWDQEILREVDISPNQRFALIGKTRSGKTAFGMSLAGLLVPRTRKLAEGWEAWWLDTKGDPKDIAALHEWGFTEKPDRKSARRLFLVRDDPKGTRNRKMAWEKAQDIFANAYAQGGVLVIVDEYVQVVKSDRMAGDDLLNIFQRGGGLCVGLIGMTQEPVFVPRQLISQASHQFLFNVSFVRDVEYLQGMFEEYVKPVDLGDSHGFFHVAVDYDGQAQYYPNQYEWADQSGLLTAA